MKRRIAGLHQEAEKADGVPERIFLVRVERALYRVHAHKPFFEVRLAILEPEEQAGTAIPGRLYCTPKALWKLTWFLRDFGYDAELLSQDEVDERALVGLRGVVKVSRATVNGRCFVNLDSFAPASAWEEVPATPASAENPEAESHDL